MKRHATEDVDVPEQTVCGLRLPARIDNADPDCKRCLRVIEARLKREQ